MDLRGSSDTQGTTGRLRQRRASGEAVSLRASMDAGAHVSPLLPLIREWELQFMAALLALPEVSGAGGEHSRGLGGF